VEGRGPGARLSAHRPGPGRLVLPLLLATWVLLPGATAVAQEAARLELTDPLQEVAVSLMPQQGITHVVFFATWCPPCTEELPRLAELEARWGGRGYRLVLVAVSGRQDAERLRGFHAGAAPPGRLLWDQSGRVAQALQAGEIPTHLLVDSQGKILLRASELNAAVEQRVEQELGRPGRPGG